MQLMVWEEKIRIHSRKKWDVFSLDGRTCTLRTDWLISIDQGSSGRRRSRCLESWKPSFQSSKRGSLSFVHTLRGLSGRIQEISTSRGGMFRIVYRLYSIVEPPQLKHVRIILCTTTKTRFDWIQPISPKINFENDKQILWDYKHFILQFTEN